MNASMLKKYGHIALFTFGWFMLPPAARKYYTWTFITCILGFFTLGQETPEEFATQPEWYEVYYLTPWSVALWVVSAYLFVRMWQVAYRTTRTQQTLREVVAIRDAEVQVDSVAVASLPETVVEPEPAPAKPKRRTTVFEHETESGIIVPSHTKRRVRRGGETLSGTPIKDRRPVDPRTL